MSEDEDRIRKRENHKRWRLKHPEKARSKADEWRRNNPEKYKATTAAYREKNRERIRANKAKHRAKAKLDAIPVFDKGQLKDN